LELWDHVFDRPPISRVFRISVPTMAACFKGTSSVFNLAGFFQKTPSVLGLSCGLSLFKIGRTSLQFHPGLSKSVLVALRPQDAISPVFAALFCRLAHAPSISFTRSFFLVLWVQLGSCELFPHTTRLVETPFLPWNRIALFL